MTHDSDWYDELAGALRSRWLSEQRITEIVAETRAHCAATGERPFDAFGDPGGYASHLVSTEDPEETRFERTAERYSWSARPVKHRTLVALGGMLAFFAAYGWLMVGDSYTLAAGQLLSMPVLVTLLALVQLREDSRDAGRPASVRRLNITYAVGSAASVLAVFLVPQSWAVRVPLWPVVVLGLAMAAVGWWLGHSWLEAHRTSAPLPRGAWLERLEGLLAARYGFTAAKAREFRTEAATHLADSGGDPEREFGPVDDYAAQLADRSGLTRRRKEPAWFVKLLMTLFCAGVTVVVIANHGLLSVRAAIIAVITLALLADVLDLVGVVNRRKRVPVQAGRW